MQVRRTSYEGTTAASRPMLPASSASANCACVLDNALDALERELRCPICLDSLSDPLRLSTCKHVFCRLCLERALVERSACPLCFESASRRSAHPEVLTAQLVASVANV